jgi:hypothetical protein
MAPHEVSPGSRVRRAAAGLERVHSGVERLLQRRAWIPFCVLVAWLLGIGFSVPTFTELSPAVHERWVRYWAVIVRTKVNNPLYDMTRRFPIQSNEAKRTYRITAPAVAYATRTGTTGAFLFNHVCAYAAMYGAILLAAALTRSRPVGFYTGLLLAATYIGMSSFKDIGGCFDSTTFAVLVLAAAQRRPFFAGAAILAALFSDERALALAPLAALTFVPAAEEPEPVRLVRPARVVAVALAMLAYVGIRATLTLTLGIGAKALPIEWDVFALNLDRAGLALWSSLEGGWIVVAAAALLGLRSTRPVTAVLYMAYFAAYIYASFFVWDVTRSSAFAFLFLFPVLPFLRDRLGARLPTLLLTAAVVSLLAANVYLSSYVDHEQRLWAHLFHAAAVMR